MGRSRGVWLMVSFLVGCPAPASMTSTRISSDDFPAAIARADCRLLLECCTAAEISGIFAPGMSFASAAECEAFYASTFRSYATAAQPHLDAGWTSWDASAAGACVAEIDAASCQGIGDGTLFLVSFGPTTTNQACLDRYVGHQALGGECGTAFDCTSGSCSDDVGAHVCIAVPTAGQACTDRCADGLGCDVRSASPTCVTRRPDGASCTPGFGDVCESRNCNGDGTCGARTPIMVCGGTF